MTSLLISVGEASGDRQAAAVVKALGSGQHIIGKVGPELQALGAEQVVGLEGHFGLSQPLSMLKELKESRRALLAAVDRHQVKRALLVDYSGFHIPLGRALKARGVHVVGFIPPKLWAWGGWRIKKARQAYDQVFTILPFEADWWSERGVSAAYCGNPIADQTPKLDSPVDGPVALVPGSRPNELSHLAPLMVATARVLLAQDDSLRFRVPVAPTLERSEVEAAFHGLPVDFVETMVEAVGGASAALVCNGTASLEVALVGTPHVITYRTGGLHWAIGNALVRLEVTSPSNLTLARTGDQDPIWDEVFQRDATPERLAQALMDLRADHALRAQHAKGSDALRHLLAQGVGIEAVAQAWRG